MNLKKIDSIVVVSLALLLASLWQLEIIYLIPYDFLGFGGFGLPQWKWRDIWYFIITVSWLMMFVWREERG